MNNKNETPASVAQLQLLEEGIKDFRQRHRAVFEEYSLLIEQYNAVLEQADKDARAMGRSVGPFRILRETAKVDAEKMCDLLGKNEFLKLGGSIGKATTYDFDTTKFRALMLAKGIPENVVKAVYQVKSSWTGPKPKTG